MTKGWAVELLMNFWTGGWELEDVMGVVELGGV